MTGPIIQTERMKLVLPCADHLPAYVAYAVACAVSSWVGPTTLQKPLRSFAPWSGTGDCRGSDAMS
jgi:hypothetical protein